MMGGKKRILLFIIAFTVVFCLGILWGKKHTLLEQIISIKSSSCDSELEFINQEIACNFQEEKNLEMVKTLETQIQAAISSAKSEGKAKEVSLFFRDLVSKKWVGIKENEKFIPASLFKFAPAVAYLKLSETDPTIMSQTYVFSPGELNYKNQYFKPKVQLKEGIEYTVEDLIRQMLIHSDNNPLIVLEKSLNPDYLDSVIYDFGIIPDEDPNADIVSPKVYANIFRTLYNSSYLEREDSEKLLKWFSESDFYDGIAAGVPSGTVVSHKFGEREFADSSSQTEKELHDCGIVYYKDNPYTLCIMTMGDDYEELSSVISDISRLVYEEMSK